MNRRGQNGFGGIQVEDVPAAHSRRQCATGRKRDAAICTPKNKVATVIEGEQPIAFYRGGHCARASFCWRSTA